MGLFSSIGNAISGAVHAVGGAVGRQRSTTFDRAYYTGDLAIRAADGTVSCIGRVDFQVKVNGVRIECGEIEEVIFAVAGVSACC